MGRESQAQGPELHFMALPKGPFKGIYKGFRAL